VYTLNCRANRKLSGSVLLLRHPLPLPTPSPVTGFSLVKKWWWTLQDEKSIYAKKDWIALPVPTQSLFTAKPIHNINCYMYAWFSSMFSNFVIRDNCTCVGHHSFASLEWGAGSHWYELVYVVRLFLSSFELSNREMPHQAPTRNISQPNSDTAMLFYYLATHKTCSRLVLRLLHIFCVCPLVCWSLHPHLSCVQ